MLVKNISARVHHVGDVVIGPGETKEVDAAYKSALNLSELQIVEQEKPRGRPKASEQAVTTE